MASIVEELRVLVVGDSPLARAGLASLLSNQPGCEVIGQVSGAELADMLDVYRPDALIWDLGWEPAQSLERLAEMGGRADNPPHSTPPVLALLADESRAAEAVNAGAHGLLFQDADGDTLLAALNAVMRGLMVLHPTLAQAAAPMPNREPQLPAESLTPRELEVMALLAEGLPNKTIAR